MPNGVDPGLWKRAEVAAVVEGAAADAADAITDEQATPRAKVPTRQLRVDSW